MILLWRSCLLWLGFHAMIVPRFVPNSSSVSYCGNKKVVTCCKFRILSFTSLYSLSVCQHRIHSLSRVFLSFPYSWYVSHIFIWIQCQSLPASCQYRNYSSYEIQACSHSPSELWSNFTSFAPTSTSSPVCLLPFYSLNSALHANHESDLRHPLSPLLP